MRSCIVQQVGTVNCELDSVLLSSLYKITFVNPHSLLVVITQLIYLQGVVYDLDSSLFSHIWNYVYLNGLACPIWKIQNSWTSGIISTMRELVP